MVDIGWYWFIISISISVGNCYFWHCPKWHLKTAIHPIFLRLGAASRDRDWTHKLRTMKTWFKVRLSSSESWCCQSKASSLRASWSKMDRALLVEAAPSLWKHLLLGEVRGGRTAADDTRSLIKASLGYLNQIICLFRSITHIRRLIIQTFIKVLPK